ncbi:MAG: DUF1003 domain-containing protein [Bacteroidales bacterium]|nr:DUF1003 domain-containing protein [Bacteroidales bacterium]
MTDHIRTFAERLIDKGPEALPPRDRRIIEHIAKRLTARIDWSAEYEESLSFGQRLADTVAAWGGSWPFIVGFFLTMVLWIGVNIGLAAWQPFDPYPFILLNLVLSTLAAVQAPVIMMSQNRQAAKDRIQALHDYEVNLKAEVEIVALHDKLDRLRTEDLTAVVARIEAKIETLLRAPG